MTTQWFSCLPMRIRQLGFLPMSKTGSKIWGVAVLQRVYHPDYNNELTQFLPRIVTLKKPPGAQLGFNIRGGKASQLGIFISKVIPDSDAHRAGLQEGDQVLAVNDVDFQDIEHSKAVEILKTAREISMRVRFFPYSKCHSSLTWQGPQLSSPKREDCALESWNPQPSLWNLPGKAN
ncbi:PDZ domain-containing protein 11 [Camelus dromedarius]|uniref:PDZ domain-containing protein 11 n=1 Tax=Camelus dromedarius TaxID=9838 RepID=A0A5N4C3V8_CAMDR|nr:PDZ domain-containing protein 11 [Camelus dromedarius]KAB1253551.1 PDZ domain-containing protein 11 [Camelus dromedarius]KAB1253552.1 PDZ domain-containing protein 11 [Camelus dromedarius]